MATQLSQNIPSLFKELNRLGKDGDYEKALKVANKLLTELPDDEKAFQCKVVCLIQLGKFEEALSTIKKNAKFMNHLIFEKAYCEYRLNRNEEILKTIKTGNQNDPRIRELLGQLYYRMEKYEESYNIYRGLIKNSQDDFEDERETNLAAVVAALQLWEDKECDDLTLREETYEMCYNAACRLIGEHSYQESLDKLKLAEEMCKKTFEDDSDASAEEINSELVIIWAQMGFVLQRLGKKDEALKLYNQVIKTKPSDAVLMAVASNNVITINKDQNMFDSKKRIKSATSGDLKNKLTLLQKQSITVNECLLHMYAGQAEQCHRCAHVLQNTSASASKGSLIEAAQFIREKNAEKAVQFLQGQIEKLEGEGNPAVTQLKFALAQIFLNQEHVYKACDVLRSLGEESYKPGIVSTLVSLYLSQEDHDSAIETLGQAVQWHFDNDPHSEDLMKLVRANANFHLNSGSAKVAAEMLEEMRKANPSDLKILAQLILAYSKFDPKKAQEVSKQFPPPEKLPQDVDLDLLETNWHGNKWVKKATKTEASPMSPKGKTEVVVKKKSRKKRKILPKNYDPSVAADAERWLPMRERTCYRGKKKNKRRDVGRGTQGAVSVGVSELDASEQPQNDEVGSPKLANGPQGQTPQGSNSNAPRQQKPTAAAAKQRPKKKKGGKW